MGGIYLHGTHGSQILPYCNGSRFSSSSPGGDLENKTRKPTRICTFYAEGQCKKERVALFFTKERVLVLITGGVKKKTGVLAPVSYGNHRGSEEGSQTQLSQPARASVREFSGFVKR